MRLKTLVLLLALLPLRAFAAEGLAVQFRQGAKTDHLVLPYPALYIENSQPPSALLEPGPFEAEFTGAVSVDLRAQYTFAAEVLGELTLLVNGKEILSATNAATNTAQATSKPVRLSKGTNSFVARFKSPATSPAMLRIYWASRNNAVPVPIPPSALTHSTSDVLDRSMAVHRGAFLVREYRCTKCHAAETRSDLDAPALDGIGSRLNPAWLAQWILDPSAHRTARMPRMFHGADGRSKAQAVAAFLSSQGAPANSNFKPTEELRKSGAALFADLRCNSCHTTADESAAPGKISLKHVAQKFVPGALVAFLQNPQAHYKANPMPNFELTAEEALALAAHLAHATPAAESTQFSDELRTRGKSLVQSSGCLNCHALDLPNQFQAPSLADLMQRENFSGCLDPASENSPRFTFSENEAAAIKAFLFTREATALAKNIPHEDTPNYLRELKCAQCHQDSGMPDPITLGGKLKPQWAARFIAGAVPYKPRPWLKPRMPAFPAHAGALAAGLAALHGHSPVAPEEPAPDPELVSIGAQLVSSTGGFSCVACHAIHGSAMSLVVESPGINLEHTAERLLPSFFHRWVMNPIAIDPATKMPLYFDNEGRSQLFEILDGDGHKQIEAIWHYIRLGDNMPPPPSP